MLLDHISARMVAGELTHKSSNFPIISLERYLEPSSVVGVGGDSMPAAYGVVLRAEFVRSNIASGDPLNPLRDLYFKVLPKGKADVPGILLGFPALDSAPFGIGWAFF